MPVKMRVFGQMCDRCESPKYEEPSFRDDTVAFVLHNLVRRILKKCYREAREIPPLPAPVSEGLPEDKDVVRQLEEWKRIETSVCTHSLYGDKREREMERLNMDFWRDVFEKQIQQVKPGDAWRLTMDQNLKFHCPSGWKRYLQEHAFASFRCSWCLHRWSSHQVVILFHMGWEPHRRQGSVKMRLFRQQCHKCGSGKYEEPHVTEGAVESILKDLIVAIRRKCYGEQVEEHELREVITHAGGPHRREYCEACSLGIHKGHYGGSRGAVYREESATLETQSTALSQDIKHRGIGGPSFGASGDPGFPDGCCLCFIIFTIVVIIVIACLIWRGRTSGAL
ncbi:hypothetical protein JRQ81_017663 [Phrynocephalus forsythii]|uniref:3CxxC-type domain-containing protein n=1 Tax=Phrynocephalus forsythii TaxID=171643 RepID=A0A9Q1B069_9SAUR|nr:hypothetical protein JRQ81_017663 [Phrynocephalus forsythii]